MVYITQPVFTKKAAPLLIALCLSCTILNINIFIEHEVPTLIHGLGLLFQTLIVVDWVKVTLSLLIFKKEITWLFLLTFMFTALTIILHHVNSAALSLAAIIFPMLIFADYILYMYIEE